MAKSITPKKASKDVAGNIGSRDIYSNGKNESKKSLVRANNVRSSLLRKSIIDAAAKLFSVRGFSGTNLQDIAAELGLSRPAIYYYYKKKEDILEELIEEVTFSIERQSNEIVDREEMGPKDALELMIRSLAVWLLEHGTHFRVVEQADKELLDDLRARHKSAKRAVLDNVTKVISRGIKTGCFRLVDARVAAFSIIGMCSWTAWWFKPDGLRSAAQVAEWIADMATHSLVKSNAYDQEQVSPASLIEKIEGDLAHLSRMITD